MNERIDAIFQQVMDENCKDPLHRFAELVRQDEREACAQLCEDLFMSDGSWCAKSIRSRDVSTKQENSDTSEKCVHETDKSVHEPWDTSDMAHRSGGLSVEQEPEPTAWVTDDFAITYRAEVAQRWRDKEWKVVPFYTAPPKREWVGLTDEEIKNILDCGRGGLVDIKKAEQILKERNNG